ncbi:MAG TPA: hypothetical protein VFE46_17425 [Pirellulales bacterium]|nr:hypothetical protein [Pirellulales bacterium]
MLLFITGYLTGTLFTAYLFLGADRSRRSDPTDHAQAHAQRWKYQRPLPPL